MSAPGPETSVAPSVGRGALIVVAGYAALVVVMLVVGYALMHPLHGSVGHWDEHANRWLAGRRTAPWDRTTGTATWFMNTAPAIGIALVIVVVLGVRHRWRLAMMLVVALALELVVFLTVNAMIDRPRPHVVRLNSTPSTSSFPSGHTAAATVLFVGLAIIVTACTRHRLARAAAIVVAVVVPLLVAFGRVYRGLHHPTDVIAGALLGAGCLAVGALAVGLVPAADEGAARSSDETASSAPRRLAG